jgi:hydrogenase maturation protease
MITVLGCGNPNRSDDGVGPHVIALLKKRSGESEGVRLLDAGIDGMAAMFAARGCKSLIIVDACQSGSEPGAVFEAPGAALENSYTPALNLHDFRWDHALHAGRRIFRDAFPADVVVLLIEAATTDFGLDLSAPVAAAAVRVALRVEALIETRQEAGEPGP